MNLRLALITLLLPATLAACAGAARNEPAPLPPVVATILSVRSFQNVSKEPSGLNTALGAAAGGVLGNQIGHGKGKTAATVAGVLGGALVGSQVGQRTHTTDMEELTLAMPDQRELRIEVPARGFQPGQRVQITVHGRQADIHALP